MIMQGKTKMVRVFGFGSIRPASSVTVKVTTNVPGVAYVTLPGVATLLLDIVVASTHSDITCS